MILALEGLPLIALSGSGEAGVSLPLAAHPARRSASRGHSSSAFTRDSNAMASRKTVALAAVTPWDWSFGTAITQYGMANMLGVNPDLMGTP